MAYKPAMHRTFLNLGDCGEEVEVDIEYKYSSGRPAKTYGPPEDCYPEEPPEAELLTARIVGDSKLFDLMSMITDSAVERIQQEIYEAEYEAQSDDCYDD